MISSLARKKRHLLFLKLVSQLKQPLTLLDLGGTYEYWKTVGFTNNGMKFILLNIYQQNVTAPFTSVVGDARDLSRYSDSQFEIVFSNSVLGHVGSFEDQKRMASEIRRVAKRYFVQTPNQGFPIDWRTLVPFFHFLPVPVQAWCLRHFRVGRYPKVNEKEIALNLASRIRNIRDGELKELFPGAKIERERILGFTKSFIIHYGF